MWRELFESDTYTVAQLLMYYTGAFFWLFTYAWVIRRIIKEKVVEFPGIVIAGNVAWELLGGFVIYPPLPFGGDIMLHAWRAGAIMDVFMMYSVFRYGVKQYSDPALRKLHPYMVSIAFIFSGALTYTYYNAGYDLPMMFNSAMILNIYMSALCLSLFFRLKEYRFSRAIAIGKFLATSVFFQFYLLMVSPDQYFPLVMGILCFILDLAYIILVFKRNKELVPV
jgi:hypothetical protein